MKEILKKLFDAKKIIASKKIVKKGVNKFSGYRYFTPEQVKELVDEACFETGLITQFVMKRNELGITAFLYIYDVESGQKLEFEMPVEIPKITATNVAQQIGGAMTYAERYLKMTAFGITDDSLDYDTTENTKETVKEQKKQTIWLKDSQFNIAIKSDAAGINAVLKKYSNNNFAMKKEYKQKLLRQLEVLKEKQNEK